jgi:hypothetical protein
MAEGSGIELARWRDEDRFRLDGGQFVHVVRHYLPFPLPAYVTTDMPKMMQFQANVCRAHATRGTGKINGKQGLMIPLATQ